MKWRSRVVVSVIFCQRPNGRTDCLPLGKCRLMKDRTRKESAIIWTAKKCSFSSPPLNYIRPRSRLPPSLLLLRRRRRLAWQGLGLRLPPLISITSLAPSPSPSPARFIFIILEFPLLSDRRRHRRHRRRPSFLLPLLPFTRPMCGDDVRVVRCVVWWLSRCLPPSLPSFFQIFPHFGKE